MKVTFYTNSRFFFAGKDTVTMPYSSRNLQLVVLVPSTQYNGRELEIGISIGARSLTMQSTNILNNGSTCRLELVLDFSRLLREPNQRNEKLVGLLITKKYVM